MMPIAALPRWAPGWLPRMFAALLGLMILSACDETPPVIAGDPPQPISIAVMPHSFTGYSLFVAEHEGFIRQQGLDATFHSFTSGKQTLAALAAGQVDFAVSSETPFIRSVMAGDDVVALAVTIHARRHLAVVARRDRGIERASDLAGKRIGVTLGSNGEYFLRVLLTRERVATDGVVMVDTPPGRMLESLQSGELDAIATWNPQMQRAQTVLADNAVAFDLDDLYAPYFLIMSRRQLIVERPDSVLHLLSALQRAARFIQQNPAKSRAIVSSHLKTDLMTLAGISAFYDFELSLNQAMLPVLEHQAAWIMHRDSSFDAVEVDFMKHIESRPLEQIAPDSVSIIKPSLR